MSLYRIHIKSAGTLGREFTFNYCLKENVLGLGYQTYSDKKVTTWGEFISEASIHHSPKALKNVRTFKDKVKKDDLIWTRSPSGVRYLAKVNSEWEYYSTEDAKNADIVNIVRCDLYQIPSIDDVPGKIDACFRSPRTFQMVDDYSCLRYSQYLWNKLSGSIFYETTHEPLENIFSFLSAEEAENLVFIFLQTQGWIVIPNSRKADTMSFEFFAKNKSSGEVATVQVKTGGDVLDRNNYKDRNDIGRTFLFQTNNYYLGDQSEKVECLSPEFMNQFIEKNLKILPANITRWHEIVSKSL